MISDDYKKRETFIFKSETFGAFELDLFHEDRVLFYSVISDYNLYLYAAFCENWHLIINQSNVRISVPALTFKWFENINIM